MTPARKITGTNIFYRNYNSKYPILVNRGGARSSKSYSIAQYIITKLISEPKRQILVTRKTMPALRDTAYELIMELLQDYGYYKRSWHNMSSLNYVYRPTGSIIKFRSLDDPHKMRSTEWNYEWLEEANEFTWDDFMLFKTRLSAPTNTRNQIILSFNPTSPHHWIKEKLVDIDQDVDEIISTYKDNPFLSREYVRQLEKIKDQDPNYWRIFGLGEWGSLDNLIYGSSYDVLPTAPDPKEKIYGIDFGWHRTAVVEIVRDKDELFYVKELLYRENMHNADLIHWLDTTNIINRTDNIYGDSANPAYIDEIFDAGYNIYPALKDKGSVRAGIDFCRRTKLALDRNSHNLLKEIRSYSWKTDKNGEVVYPEEPVKYNDHLMDAMRYALYTHYRQYGDSDSVSCDVF